jgi:hypothetical protein
MFGRSSLSSKKHVGCGWSSLEEVEVEVVEAGHLSGAAAAAAAASAAAVAMVVIVADSCWRRKKKKKSNLQWYLMRSQCWDSFRLDDRLMNHETYICVYALFVLRACIYDSTSIIPIFGPLSDSL